MKFSLVVARGAKEGAAIPITKSEFIVGRDANCHLRPTSQTISKRHSAFLVRDGRFFVMDLQSTNGTFVNDEQLHGERELKAGDSVKIGPLEFKVRFEAEKPAQVGRETRAPIASPTAATKTGSETLGEDEIGSLLLDLTDDDKAPGDDADLEGTTIMQVLKPEEALQLNEAQEEKAPYRPPSKLPASSQNTSSAAKAILEKYRRRPRQ
jgi:pSer/pThr/pTyr-binding forkhead associated (FHA) protein